MEREIKFRAWIVEDEIMIHSDKLCFEQFLPLKNLLNDNNDIQKIMQYTGLKDKNDVEIYEGDIISTPYFGNLQVIYSLHSGGFIYYPIDKNAMCSPSDKVINDLYHLNYSKDINDIVDYFNKDNNGNYFVIGNIYENPDLLKG